MLLLSRSFGCYELIGQAPRSRWPCGWWRGQACRFSAWSREKEAAIGSLMAPLADAGGDACRGSRMEREGGRRGGGGHAEEGRPCRAKGKETEMAAASGVHERLLWWKGMHELNIATYKICGYRLHTYVSVSNNLYPHLRPRSIAGINLYPYPLSAGTTCLQAQYPQTLENQA